MKEKPTVDSPFFRAFPSDRITKARNDVNVYFFIHSSNYCELYQLISVNYANEFEERLGDNTYMSRNENQLQYNIVPLSKRSQFNCTQNVSCRISTEDTIKIDVAEQERQILVNK